MSCNFLKINEDKTKLLLISSNNENCNVFTDLCILFSGNIITPSLDAVNLGVTFDSTMSMTPYINSIVSRGYWQLSNFWKTADKLTYELKLQLVTSYILPLIDYCNITLIAASKCNLKKLQKLLNSAIRFIFNMKGRRYCHSVTPYLKKAHILPVEYRVKYKVALTVYKCFNNLAPVYICRNSWCLRSHMLTYALLMMYSHYTLLFRRQSTVKTLFHMLPLLYGMHFHRILSFVHHLIILKKRLKSFYFVEYFGTD